MYLQNAFKIRTVGLLLLLVSTLHAQKDNVRFERIQAVQGQQLGFVNHLLQDSKGFMWFGTFDGLYKYDGYSLTAYRHDRLDSTSLGNNRIFALHEDRNGTLWIGASAGGLNRYDRKQEHFARFVRNPDDSTSISAGVVSSIFADRSGTLWIGTWRGLNKLDRDTGQFTRYVSDPESPHSLSRTWIWAIHEDSAGALWVGGNGGVLVKLDRDTEQFTHINDPESPHGLGSHTIMAIIEDRFGTLWVGTEGGGLGAFDLGTGEMTRFTHDPENPHSLSHNWVYAIYEDRTGTLWIGTPGGLNRFDREQEQFTRFVHDPQNPYSLSHNNVQGIHEDRTGTLWFATADGVNRLDREQQRFAHIVHDPENPNSLSHNWVYAIHEDRSGTLWVGTAAGLTNYDRATGKMRHFVDDPKNPNNFGFNNITSILEDSTGDILVGTRRSGLHVLNRDTEKFSRFVHDPENPTSLGANHILSIEEDRFGTVWIGTEGGGLNRFDRNLWRFTRFVHDPENPHSISDNHVRAIHVGASGRLWIGMAGTTNEAGLCLYDRDREQFIRFGADRDNPHSLSRNWVGVVFEDRAGTLWATAWYAGLNKLDLETGLFTIYSEKDGLLSDHIGGILEDDHGRLWMATHNGLSRFDPLTETFENFGGNDGFLHKEFNWNANIRSRSGEMFFGGDNGIHYFHPDSIRANPHIPPVVITRFIRYNDALAKGKPIIEKGISEREHLELSHKDRTLTFEFAALNYRNTRKNQYAYKLEGFNDNWMQLGSKHDISFTNLDPGEYTLRVKGSNNDGVWNEEGTSLKITITPPWWQTWWAYTIYSTIFGLALYGLRKYELKRVQLKNALEKQNFESRKLQEIDAMKSRFFADISHEFRTPLTLILGPFQKALRHIKDRKTREDVRAMQRNAHRLQRLVEQLLDLSRIEAHRMPLRAQKTDIVQKIREWVASFVSLAESKNITMDLHFPEQPIMAYFDAEKLEKVVYNLLSNAFKFTPEGGEIKVAVAVGGRWGERESGKQEAIPCSPSHPLSHSPSLKITVRDSGVGIPSESLPHIFDRFYRASEALSGEQGGTGIGLALAKEFVELHHGEIRVESKVGKGSTFTVLLPLGREHLSDEEIVHSEIEDRGPETGNRWQEAISDEQETAHGQQSIPTDTSSRLHPPASGSLVLIVEDNADMRRYLRNALTQDFDIIEAENGQSGYQVACKKTPDLIVSDVMMPVMDGFALCEKLKTDQRTSHIPVILLTARAGQEDKLEGLEIGADDYLTKPFDARELNIRAKNLIEQRQRLRERFRREITVQPKEITITSIDEKFLQRAIDIVEENMPNSEFDIDQFCRVIGMSRSTLNRKLRALTGLSTNGFIRVLRLKRASQLLQKKSATIVEIAYEVGFNNPSYFAECFRQQFGVKPSEFSGSSSSN